MQIAHSKYEGNCPKIPYCAIQSLQRMFQSLLSNQEEFLGPIMDDLKAFETSQDGVTGPLKLTDVWNELTRKNPQLSKAFKSVNDIMADPEHQLQSAFANGNLTSVQNDGHFIEVGYIIHIPRS
jgi:hypothetical protein